MEALQGQAAIREVAALRGAAELQEVEVPRAAAVLQMVAQAVQEDLLGDTRHRAPVRPVAQAAAKAQERVQVA